jgi:hypothetical protein
LKPQCGTSGPAEFAVQDIEMLRAPAAQAAFGVRRRRAPPAPWSNRLYGKIILY